MYATEANLLTRYGTEITDLADRDGNGAADVGVIERALKGADATINSYIETRYSLPLASTPEKLTDTACEIARYKLYTDGAPEQVAEDYKNAIAWLKDVAAKRASLGLDDAAEETPSTGGPQISAPDRVFTKASLSGF